jgi:hypothetical protein
MHLRFNASPSSKFWLSFASEPQIDLKVDTAIGEHQTIKKLQTLSDVLIVFIKKAIIGGMTLPHYEDFPLPAIKFDADNNKNNINVLPSPNNKPSPKGSSMIKDEGEGLRKRSISNGNINQNNNAAVAACVDEALEEIVKDLNRGL